MADSPGARAELQSFTAALKYTGRKKGVHMAPVCLAGNALVQGGVGDGTVRLGNTSSRLKVWHKMGDLIEKRGKGSKEDQT